ncbi:MAG: hypothetical protein ACUVQY_01330 [Thermoproteota archaeon]
MLSVAMPEAIWSTTQFITVFWLMDKVTRIILDRVKYREYECSIMGLRIHHWFIGVIMTIMGLLMLSAQNLIMLFLETGIIGIPWKLSSSAITVGFRLFLDDMRDLKKQLKGFVKRINPRSGSKI